MNTPGTWIKTSDGEVLLIGHINSEGSRSAIALALPQRIIQYSPADVRSQENKPPIKYIQREKPSYSGVPRGGYFPETRKKGKRR